MKEDLVNNWAAEHHLGIFNYLKAEEQGLLPQYSDEHVTSSNNVMDGDLGGCGISGDVATHYPHMWTYLVDKLSISKVIDVGCGFGHSLRYFKDVLNCSIQGVEGSAKVALTSDMSDYIIQHDYTKGPFTPKEKFDLCWSCEFVEHVEHQFIDNYMETFRSADYAAITFAAPGQGGHHHVNENTESYWIKQFSARGFIFDQNITYQLRGKACEDFQNPKNPVDDSEVLGWDYLHHFVSKGLFFKNSNVK
jgi:SAM-dependent methyltransferase